MLKKIRVKFAELSGGNYFDVAVTRFLIVLATMMLSRILFYIANCDLLGIPSFSEAMSILWGGLRFDLSAAVYINGIVILLELLPIPWRYGKIYSGIVTVLFYIVNVVALAANYADTVYVRFTGKRTTFDIFKEFGDDGNIGSIVAKSIFQYWWVTLMFIGTVVFFVWLSRKVKPRKRTPYNIWIALIANTLILAVSVVLCIGAVRGGFAHSTRPITLSNASEYVTLPIRREAVLNTPFSFLRTIGVEGLKRKEFFTAEELPKHFSAYKKAPLYIPDTMSFAGKPMNVVVIIMESMCSEITATYNRDIEGYKGYTPHLDSIFSRSRVFLRSAANGRKSIDAMPSILASVPSLQTPFVLSSYSGNTINSIASILNDRENAAFFHGAPNGSMGFLAFSRQAGFKNYYGKTEYGNDADYDGIWGIWDEPFLLYMNKTLDSFKQPFFATVFTLSSHHPFKVPEKYQGRFPKGKTELHESAGYTDMAIGRFFEEASKKEWFDNTIFVITADHTTGAPYMEQYKTAKGVTMVPIVFYVPSRPDLAGVDSTTIASQCDIMPSLCAMLGVKHDFVSFGNNLFDPSTDKFAVSFNSGDYQITMDDYFLSMRDDKPISMFNYVKDPLLKDNIIDRESETAQRLSMKLEAYIQEYNNRLIDNDMVAK